MALKSDNPTRSAVLLLAHGAPDRLEDIPEFLLRVREGRKLPEPAVREIVRRYEAIGGSPLLRRTSEQAEALAQKLGRRVYFAMRNWKPFIPEAVRRMREDGVEQAVAICMAPQNSRTSIGLYRRHLDEAIEREAPGLEIEFVESWHDSPLLASAFAEKVSQALALIERESGRAAPVIFTAHSVPEKTIREGDPYASQVRETATLVAKAAGLAAYRLAYQSQGMSREPWIGPTVEAEIDEVARAGASQVLIAPIGFLSDHVEILYDVDVVFREHGRGKGVKVFRTESLNASPRLIEALASIADSRAKLPIPPLAKS